MCLGDYHYLNINTYTLLISTLYTIQYVQVLDRLIREVGIVEPALGPVYILKEDVSNGFYRIGMQPTDAPNTGLVFPADGIAEELVSIMLTLPMGWNKSPPIFCMATETVTDLANTALCCNHTPCKHKLYDHAEMVVILDLRLLQTTLAGLI